MYITSTLTYFTLTLTSLVGTCRSPIMRGKEHLGYLIIETNLDVVAEKMNLLNTDRKSTAFFTTNSPKGGAVRAANPSYITAVGTYSMELKCRDICKESDEVMNSSCFLYVRACLNVQKFETPLSLTKFLPSNSPRIMEIWKSLKNYNKPYDINALEIKFSHSTLTGLTDFDSVLRHEINKKLKLIIEIWVGGTEGDLSPPIRTSFVTYSVHKLLDAAGYPKSNYDSKNPTSCPWSKPIPRDFIRLAHLSTSHLVESDSDKSEKFFSKIFSKKKKNEDDEYGISEVKVDKKSGIVNRPLINNSNLPKSENQNINIIMIEDKEKIKKSELPTEGNGDAPLENNIDPTTENLMKTEKKKFSFFGSKKDKKKALEDEKKRKEEEELKAANENRRSNSILSLNDVGTISNRGSIFNEILEREAEEKRKKELAVVDTKPVVAVKVTGKDKKEAIKKAKKRESKINADFEKEMVAATTYRDPFLER